jgi:phosphoglycerate dehydrogenase-like enzyme
MSVFAVLAGPRLENGYREIAESLFSPHGRLEWIDWLGDEPVPGREERFARALAEADAVISTPWLGAAPFLAMPEFDAGRFAGAPRLRVLAGTYDFRVAWIDLAEAARRGVTVVDTSRSMTPTVAEFALAMTFNLLRAIPQWIDVVRGGGWSTSPPDGDGFVYGDLHGRRVGLAGYGSINRSYRRFVEPFGCEVSTSDPFVDDETLRRDGVTRAGSLVELASSSEIFMVGIPPTPATIGVISADVIDALPRGALFVLPTRMAVVAQDALWRRLQAGEIRAAIDVFDPEPPPADAWFRNHPNVLATPHIAGNARHAHRRCFSTACEDAVSVVAGGDALYPVGRHDTKLYEGLLTT